jgi:ceramide glucosyltransferase
VILNVILGALALLSLALLLWQWVAAVRFPLHQRSAERLLGTKGTEPNAPNGSSAFQPGVTLLKSLKGADDATEDCLRSWFAQDYAGEVQILFAVASADDPVGGIVRKLTQEFPQRDILLLVCTELVGANAKVSKLAELEKLAKHEILVVSDADVRVPPDFLANAVAPLRDPQVGLVNCFYRLANPSTLAMQWEAIAINADFWSQVLQSQTLKPLDFALGAVMLTRRKQLEDIGGFKSLADCLADDYQLGNRIARKGHRIVLCPIVVECWDPPMTWRAVWKHQLRWARTIRVCQQVPYFFSILSNAGFWAILALVVGLTKMHTHWSPPAFGPGTMSVKGVTDVPLVALVGGISIVIRMILACDFQRRLTRSSGSAIYFWMVPIKDLLQTAIWLCAFAGNSIEWRGQTYRLRRDGTLAKANANR